MGRIEETYKARDVEEIIDIYFYRRLGFAFAVLAHKMHLTPNFITILGMISGVLAGHFFFYTDLSLNMIGILFWVLGQALDGADGQLARMANMRSQVGRILDGLADNVKFFSVYMHIFFRLAGTTPSANWWFFSFVLLAGFSHSIQSAVADLYRNAYLFFVINPGNAELDDSEQMTKQFMALSWRRQFLRKILAKTYQRYTKIQESWAFGFFGLQKMAVQKYGYHFPDWLRNEYQKRNKPNIRYYNAMTTNTRMVVLYFLLFINGIFVYFDSLYLYFAFDLIVLNGVLLFIKKRQTRINSELEIEITNAQD